jgi:quinolinate synthase
VLNVFRWALKPASEGGAAADKILAVPDQHLGRNCALALGYGLDECAVYDPAQPSGGLARDAVRRAKFLLWKGQCYVHQCFRPHDIAAAKSADSGVQVIVHPECPYEVTRLADAAGSTEQIIRAISEAPVGSRWAVGTEANLVRRLAARFPDKSVQVLGHRQAHCVQMARITLAHLLWVLDSLAEGKPLNVVSVPPPIAADARIALDRMIAIRAVAEVMRLRS